MKIKYVGHFKRTVTPYAWSPGGSVEVTDAEMVVNLLTNPLNDFEIDPAEPLLAIAGSRTADLALAGLATVAQLAALDKENIKRVAETLKVTQKQISTWVQTAQASLQELQED